MDLNEKVQPVKQRLHRFAQDRKEDIRVEVTRLLAASFIREVTHPEWLANPVLVKTSHEDHISFLDPIPQPRTFVTMLTPVRRRTSILQKPWREATTRPWSLRRQRPSQCTSSKSRPATWCQSPSCTLTARRRRSSSATTTPTRPSSSGPTSTPHRNSRSPSSSAPTGTSSHGSPPTCQV